jgi:hypothetical protein
LSDQEHHSIALQLAWGGAASILSLGTRRFSASHFHPLGFVFHAHPMQLAEHLAEIPVLVRSADETSGI